MPTMLDLFAGLGGASRAMRERGWNVTTVDVDPRFGCDVTTDVRTFHWTGGPVDLLWASPPCDEFSRESMPWCRTGVDPDVSLIGHVLRIESEIAPRFWLLENVRGARPWLKDILGPPVISTGPIYLWGRMPPLLLPDVRGWKERLSSSRTAERAEMPWEISHAVALAVEACMPVERIAP